MHDKTCGAGDLYLVINHRGKISKCHMELDFPITSVFEKDPLLDLQADQTRFQNISVDAKIGCSKCQWRYWCTGGCPLLAQRTTGQVNSKSPYCNVYKIAYPELLRLEGLRIMKQNSIPVAV